ITQLEEKGIEPLAYKLFCYTAHYRTKLNFTFEGAISSQKALNRLRENYIKHKNGNDNVDDSVIEEYREKFLEATNDDLNMPLAMGIVWEIVKNENKTEKIANLLIEFDKVLGLDLIHAEQYLDKQNNVDI